MTKQLFKPGDVVGCIWAEGPYKLEASGLDGPMDRVSYPIAIRIKHGNSHESVNYLTQEGKYYASDKYPSVWHWKIGSPPVAGERPKWKPDKPTWCWVWDNGIAKTKRLVSELTEDGKYLAAIIISKDEMTQHRMSWEHAEPCSPEDIPEWWPEDWK